MNTVFIYFIKAAFYMAVFYLVYSALLSKDTMYRRNRAFILLSVLSALILPFITIQTNNPVNISVFGKTLSEIIVYGTNYSSGIINNEESGISALKIFWVVYLAGVCLFGVKLLIDFAELFFLILQKKNSDNHIIKFQGYNTSGFSALGYVFINAKLTNEESAEIIRHEQNHLDHNHFFDIVFIEMVSVFQWFNPFIYLFNRSLRAVHEYQADECCLKTGIPVFNYQSLLLNQVFKSNIINLTNCFSNPTLIKKRMIMMTKKRSKTMTNFKLLMVLPFVATIMFAFSSSNEKQVSELPKTVAASLLVDKQNYELPMDEAVSPLPSSSVDQATSTVKEVPEPSDDFTQSPATETLNFDTQTDSLEQLALNAEAWVIVEEMPVFPGGEEGMRSFILSQLQYPKIAQENNVQGTVIVSFRVNFKGLVDQIKILKGVDPELDAEAIRVIGQIPQCTPGRQSGKPVNVSYTWPIRFQLKQ